jgi:hypothetical protein
MYSGAENMAPEEENTKRVKNESTALNKRSSALPRFQSTRKASMSSSLDNPSLPTTAASAIVPTVVSTPPEPASKTPMKDTFVATISALGKTFGINSVKSPKPNSSSSAVGKTPASAARRRRPTQPPTPGAQVKTYFDGLSVHEEKITEIMGTLKVKNKYDTKEKEKKQLQVITELRTALKTTLDEVKSVCDKSVDTEKASNLMIHNAHAELDTLTQFNTDITASERSLQKDVEVLRAERDILKKSLENDADSKSKKLTILESENINLKLKVQEIENNNSKMSAKLSNVDGNRAQLENEIKQLKQEIAAAKQEIAEANAMAHEKYEQV